MTAGASAAREARDQIYLAEAHDRAADAAREAARRFNAGAAGERRVREALRPLEELGYHVLEDRRWPGSRRANVDFVVVGRGGLFLVDAKNWREVAIEGGAHDTRVLRDQEDVTDDILRLADLADTVEALVAEHGVAPSVVRPIAVLTGSSGIRARVHTVEVLSEREAFLAIAHAPALLSPRQVDLLDAAARLTMPAYELGPRPGAVVATPSPTRHLAPVEDAPLDLLSLEEVEEGFLAAHLADPIEEWMTFLHPEQVKVVRRSFSGPSRIRGAAGTGKTVVGLHRAAYLARTRPGRVLVTTYVRTLPDVLRTLLGRLAPDAVDRVDFAGVFDVAKTALADRGIRSQLDVRAATAAWKLAWRTSSVRETLQAIDTDEEYWHDEITQVVKGRGITDLARYEDCARPGRRRALTQGQRATVWTLFEEYDRALRMRGAWDFADVISAARSALAQTPGERYSAVIVDEAQDLSAGMVAMLHALVGDGPDGLTLIGDGQQTIYPGGYTLPELGISIAGRGVVMSRNYRNTVEIAGFAADLVRDDEFSDIEGGRGTADAVELTRHGAVPVLERFTSITTHDQAFARHIRGLVESGIRHGDIGVLCRTNRLAEDAIELLRRLGVPVVPLTRWDGASVDAVKVGTVHRAKGLEFARIALFRTASDIVGPADTDVDGARAEYLALSRRALYVAATRARDGLWVGVV